MPEVRYTVCIDGWTSVAGLDDLRALPVEAASLVEVYMGGSPTVRIYARDWMLHGARIRRVNLPSLEFGCGG